MTLTRIALALLLLALPALGTVPPVLAAPGADSVRTDTPAAPLIIPGRSTRPDAASGPTPSNAMKQYALGRELERQGHPAAAISAYRNAVRLDPTIPEAHFRMGRLFSAVSQHKVAAREYAAELRLNPNHLPAARWLGLEQAQLGDTAAAIRRLRDLTERYPSDEPSWQALGFALSTAGRTEEGERALRRALTLDPADADAWRDLGVILAATHRLPEAREAYRHAIRLAPGDAGAQVNLGNLELRAQQPESALVAYRAALACDSAAALAWRGQVSALVDLGRADEAGATYRAWLARAQDAPSLRMDAMKYFASIGRKDIALELARDGVRATPRSAEAHLALGMALHESGSERAALAELRRAEALFVRAESSGRVGALIRSLRAGAPDSLRALFAADSVANEANRPSVPADSVSGRRRR